MAEMSFCTQLLQSNSAFQFTMTEAAEGFFRLSAAYLPCMSCQNAASLFLYIIFLIFLFWRWTWAVGRGVVTVLFCLSCQAYPPFHEIPIWKRVQLTFNIRHCAYGVCQRGLYMSCFIPDSSSDGDTLISSHNHMYYLFPLVIPSNFLFTRGGLDIRLKT